MPTHIKPFILSPDTIFPKDLGIVTFKKFYALKQLSDKTQYDYFIVCDAEIDLIAQNFTESNILSKIEGIFLHKRIFSGTGSDNTDTHQIIKTSANAFTDPIDFEFLRKKTGNFTSYFWWSDLPVYKREHLPDFFATIDANINSKLNFFYFDYMIYQFYLMLKHNFEINDISPITKSPGSLETLFTRDDSILKKLRNTFFGFAWIAHKQYAFYPQFFDRHGTFLIYHLDRG